MGGIGRARTSRDELPAYLVIPAGSGNASQTGSSSRMHVHIPAQLVRICEQVPDRATWLADVPHIVRELTQRWAITIGSPFTDASCAWVAPAERADGTPAVVKVGLPHMEGEHEIAGLRFWAGDPTVRLLESDEPLGAMLLERADREHPLRAHAEPDQDVIIAGLLRRLWRLPPTPHPFRPLSDMLVHWGTESAMQDARWLDPGLVRQGLRYFEDLPRTADHEALLATDLHAGNVLAATREPWLVIDPKPFIGDPAYDATQHLLNCNERLRRDAAGTIARFSDLLEVDAERVRLWLFARLAAEPRDNWGDPVALELARGVAL